MKNAPVRLVLLLAAPLACSSDGVDTTELTDEAHMLEEGDVGAEVEDEDPDVEAFDTPASELGVLDQGLAANENQRICYAASDEFHADQWVDLIVVNTTWTRAHCDAWGASIGANTTLLGCLMPNDFTWSNTGPLPFQC